MYAIGLSFLLLLTLYKLISDIGELKHFAKTHEFDLNQYIRVGMTFLLLDRDGKPCYPE